MIRVVFVDDEPQVLDGLRRSLRRLRSEWEMEFAEGARQALACMEERPADVLITDMRMPGMDGAELLVEVSRRWPSTARFILSGHVDMEGILRSVRVAHQFLSKPCDSTTIQEVVDRTMKLQHMLSNQAVRDWVGRIDSLPTPPSLYTAILESTRDPDVEIAAIARVVEGDSSVSAKILQLVNSSFFGLAQEVTSMTQAVGLLGIQYLRDLVLTVEVFRPSDGIDEGVIQFLDAVQRHSSQVAIAARLLQPDESRREITFTSGLLHDVGCTVFASRTPDRYAEVIRLARATARPLSEIEIEEWGVDHAAVGAALLAYWGLPYPIIEAAAYHRKPSATGSSRATPLTYVHVAGALLARQKKDGVVHLGQPELDLDHLSSLGLAGSVEKWADLIAERCRDV